jgi:hypothetical protein
MKLLVNDMIGKWNGWQKKLLVTGAWANWFLKWNAHEISYKQIYLCTKWLVHDLTS